MGVLFDCRLQGSGRMFIRKQAIRAMADTLPANSLDGRDFLSQRGPTGALRAGTFLPRTASHEQQTI